MNLKLTLDEIITLKTLLNTEISTLSMALGLQAPQVEDLRLLREKLNDAQSNFISLEK